MSRLLHAAEGRLAVDARAIDIARDPGGMWETLTRDPAPDVRHIVAGRYLGWTERSGAPNRRREVPFLGIPLILNLGSAFALESASGQPMALSSFVAGMYDEHVLVGSTGRACCLQVNLTPLGAWRVLRQPMHTLTNRTVALDDVVGADGRSLVERLGATRSWADSFAVIDAFLRHRLDRAPDIVPAVAASLAHLRATAGRSPVAELLAATGSSPKRLIADFRERVGLPPKALSRVLRFEHALACMRRADGRFTWSAVALECGYYDQAHLIREFRALAGCTPTALLAGTLADGGIGAA